jgi:hypothetical protein
MSYIGKPPAEHFTSFATQTFSVSATTSYTLDHAVANENEIALFVNNVRQQPGSGKAYTASGTALTLSAATASTDTMYCIFLGRALQTVTPATNSITGDMLGTGFTITATDNSDTLTLKSTDADANPGPVLALHRDSASPADNDVIGRIDFVGENSADEAIDYVSIFAKPSDVTDGTEDFKLIVQGKKAGTDRNLLQVGEDEIVVNEDSVDTDFRVESNTNTHAFFVEGSTSHVGIGMEPVRELDVAGVVRFINGSTTAVDAGYHQIVDIGANTYTLKIHNKASSPASQYMNEVGFTAAAPDNNSARFFNMVDNSAARCDIYSDGDIKNHDNSYGSLSDQRIKQNIVDSGSQWDDIKAVKVRKFKKKDDVRQYGDEAWVQIGVIAQELEAAGMDKLIRHSEPSPSDILSDSTFGTLYEDGDEIPEGKAIGDIKEIKAQVKGVGYSVLYMKAIKALQEAQTRIETLESKVKILEDA